jgi:hypothetical protein
LKELQTYYGNKLSCIALSTAFEDFQINTEENAKLLVNTGELVGERIKSTGSWYLNWESSTLSLPILIDEVINQSELQKSEFVESVIINMLDQTTTSPLEQENMRTSLHNYFSQLPQCGKTFAANLMRGTPSFFLFTDSMEILVQWFGHGDSRLIRNKLDIFIDKKHG